MLTSIESVNVIAPGVNSTDSTASAKSKHTKRPDLLSPDLNDLGNSERIAACHGADMLWCPDERSWRVWNGSYWTKDNSAAFRFASDSIEQFKAAAKRSDSKQAEKLYKFAVNSLNKGKLDSALSTLANFKNAPVSAFDRSPYLLNFRNGTVDLQTGELRTHKREDCITRVVNHDFDPSAKAPMFLHFLDQIFNGNVDTIEYVQRALGYSLTGETSERAVFIAHGTGTNGKSTLLDLIRDLISGYSTKIMIESLVQNGNGANMTGLADLADLRGARFASTSEGEANQKFGATLKRITQGGGVIKASRKYENPIEFPESHKLWIDTNHLPVLPAEDTALWNRIHPIEFSVTVPKDQIDLQLGEKLRAEAEGILAWLVEGAAQWYKRGLQTPETITQAREAWRKKNEFDSFALVSYSPFATAKPTLQ